MEREQWWSGAQDAAGRDGQSQERSLDLQGSLEEAQAHGKNVAYKYRKRQVPLMFDWNVWGERWSEKKYLNMKLSFN